MAAFVKFQPFAENVYEKKFNFGSDTFKVVLTNTVPDATDGVLADIAGQISLTNLSSNTLTVSSSAQTSGTFKWVVADLVLTASGAVSDFRYIVIYDDTATNDELVGYWDRGSTLSGMASGDTFTCDFDGTNGVLQHA